MKYLKFFFFFVAIVWACQKPNEIASNNEDETFQFNLPDWAPLPPIPENNSLTIAKVNLGKILFHEKKLSKNFDLSCATCHPPENAFAQNIAVPLGDENKPGFRNAPSLVNTAYKKFFFHDGGVRSLELQVLVPFDTHFEFNLSLPDALDRLNNDTFYVQAFKKAFNTSPDVNGITKAIAAYQRTLVSFNSKFDEFFYEKQNVFNSDELAGFNLFNLHCSSCHQGINFSNQQFYATGLPILSSDLGRFRITRLAEDSGKFMTPNLRNVAITAPYMHNGSISTLQEVLQFYSNEFTPNKDASKGLQLSTSEQTKIIAFLNTLTHKNFLE